MRVNTRYTNSTRGTSSKYNVIYKVQSFVRREYSNTHTHMHTHTRAHTHARARTHTEAPAHTSILIIQNLTYTQLKTGSKQRLETNEDSSPERKTWQVYSLGKRNCVRLHLNESREFLSERKGKVIPCRWTEEAREPTAESLVRGIWRLHLPRKKLTNFTYLKR